MLQLATDSFQASLISWTTIIDLLAIYIRNVYSL
jgi:ABC-type long-subunit fatty acid transport system fused permease/ATPase subunit